MQIFIVGSILETAKALDKRRLNKQIIECKQILAAIDGESKAWSNHPVVLEYKHYREWVRLYNFVLEEYRNGNYTTAEAVSDVVMSPEFHTDEFLTQMKRRLYTKDNTHYKQWEHLGETQENWYFVDGIMRKYVNGHRTDIK